MSQEKKGKNFEKTVGLVLTELRTRHPQRVDIIEQLRITLYDDRVIIPDFDLRFRMHHGEERFLVECQNRERSQPGIADKIRTAKSLSDRNKFIFVASESIPEATKQALERGGVLAMVFNEFVDFIAKIDMNLTALESQSSDEARKVRDAYSKWPIEDDYPGQVVKDPPPGWGEDDLPRPPR